MAPNFFRLARVLEGYRLHEVSDKAQISMGRLSYIERGIRVPTEDEYKRLTKVLPMLNMQKVTGK